MLTSIKGIPVVVKCKTIEDVNKFKTKGAMQLSRGVWAQNEKYWTQESDIDYVCDLINEELGEHECWIRREDAFQGELKL